MKIDKNYILWMLLSATVNAVVTARRKKRGTRLSYNQTAALSLIGSFDGELTQGMIARCLFKDRQSVSEIIAKMKNKGLITKKEIPNNAKMYHISLTNEGRKTFYKSIEQDFIVDILNELSEDELEQLESSLQKILSKAMDILEMDSDIPFITK
jgi:DNA-binding MarR family transcriptional regulator